MVLSRDHHDVSGTDSPFRETSNIYDGSAFCAGEENQRIFLSLNISLLRRCTAIVPAVLAADWDRAVWFKLKN